MINIEEVSASTEQMLLDNIQSIVDASKHIDGCDNPMEEIKQAIKYLIPALTIEHDSAFMNIINDVLTGGNCVPIDYGEELDDDVEKIFSTYINKEHELDSANVAIEMFDKFCSLPELYKRMSYTTLMFYVFYSAGRTNNDNTTLLTESLVKAIVNVAISRTR